MKNDQEKANLLNHTFINQNTCLNLEGFPIGPTQLKSVFTIQDICPADVRKIIKSLLGPGVVGPLTTLFNLSLHSNRVPDEWKEAIVCPIFKGGRKARQDPTNYRPISLTSCVARTMEKLVNNQMLAYLSENSLLYKHQSGYSFQTTQLLPNYATSLTSGKWPLRKESKFIRFSWILVKPMIGCLYLAYCSSYRIWVFQTQLCNGCHRF